MHREDLLSLSRDWHNSRVSDNYTFPLRSYAVVMNVLLPFRISIASLCLTLQRIRNYSGSLFIRILQVPNQLFRWEEWCLLELTNAWAFCKGVRCSLRFQMLTLKTFYYKNDSLNLMIAIGILDAFISQTTLLIGI